MFKVTYDQDDPKSGMLVERVYTKKVFEEFDARNFRVIDLPLQIFISHLSKTNLLRASSGKQTIKCIVGEDG